jgi:steroid delta-isomerase-like uncharacterized protein
MRIMRIMAVAVRGASPGWGTQGRSVKVARIGRVPVRPAIDMIDYRERTLEVNDRTYAAWNAHDPDAVAAVFAEDAVVREFGSPDVARGRAAVRERAVALLTAFPDFHLERIELIIDGERHADRWVMTGTHRGALFGIPPTGRRVRIEGATFTRLGPDGLVVEDVHLSDRVGLLAQLGIA